ncbi:MAG: hypothetical protein ACLFNI_07940 [Natronomonas sp.]
MTNAAEYDFKMRPEFRKYDHSTRAIHHAATVTTPIARDAMEIFTNDRKQS